MIEVFQNADFDQVAITHRYDCFEGTPKERTARRYGVIGVNLSAVKAGK